MALAVLVAAPAQRVGDTSLIPFEERREVFRDLLTTIRKHVRMLRRPTGKDPPAETTETQVAHVISARGEEPTGLCAKRRQSNRHP
jgi:hypothetical protein